MIDFRNKTNLIAQYKNCSTIVLFSSIEYIK